MSGPESAAQVIEPLLFSVREAAKLLSKSKSTVYRMDREHGSIRFVRRGWRVLIDAASIDAYLTGKRRTNSDTVREEALGSVEVPIKNEEHPDGTLNRNEIKQVPSLAIQNKMGSPSSGGGQRGLVFPQRRQPFVVIYMV
jgi:excisionase family DNA binding protein